MRLFLLLLIGSLSITACGQKGPLYKSSPTKVELNQPENDQSTKDTPAKRDAEPQAETDKTQ